MASSNAGQAPWVGKKYKLVSSDNFDNFLKAKGVGLIARKMANSVTPTVALSVDDAGIMYTLHTMSTFKNSSSTFKLDEEFDEETPDGRTVRSIISMEDGGRRFVHRLLGHQPTVIVRTFTETEAHVTMTFNGVTCTRQYAVVN